MRRDRLIGLLVLIIVIVLPILVSITLRFLV